jgi:hypothetical protein
MDELVKRYRIDLAHLRERLDELSSGRMTLRHRGPSDPEFVDITPREIERIKQTIAVYEGILSKYADKG